MPAYKFMLELVLCILLACVLIFLCCVAVATIAATIKNIKKGGRKNGN